jgi:hypothetical protein
MQKTFCQDSAASGTMGLQKCKDKAGRLKERGSASAVAVVQFVSWGSFGSGSVVRPSWLSCLRVAFVSCSDRRLVSFPR